ncbi:putative colanic acid biosynthesis acetyltransferase [uncultured Erythrobacter sp.]|uniref:putative colanic acid biosynthesis acetyltransferase n=1 Tax=uncultured Erythrobacter sp. TaxID=263913 RepID=UPI0026583DC9|nr:putative colanic acid biosynthesis acetyltransferase [uncultured Erythrobacter sp.]
MLRLFGAQIGASVHIYPTARIAIPWNLQVEDYVAIGDHAIIYSLGKIHLKARATVSQYAHLCAGTHDWRDKAMPLLKPPITIGEDVWICAEAFVGPGVHVAARAIVGARAVVTKDIDADQIVVGNPARQIGLRQP